VSSVSGSTERQAIGLSCGPGHPGDGEQRTPRDDKRKKLKKIRESRGSINPSNRGLRGSRVCRKPRRPKVTDAMSEFGLGRPGVTRFLFVFRRATENSPEAVC